MNRETRIGIGLVALLGAVTFGLLLIGSIGEPREELQRLTVAQVLAQDSPADLTAIVSCGSWAGTRPWMPTAWSRRARRHRPCPGWSSTARCGC